jgi:hypothetical protein
MNDTPTQVAPAPAPVASALPLVRTIAELTSDTHRIGAVIASVMKEGRHYGHIPGTGQVEQTVDGKKVKVPRKTLLKPGVEILARTFHLALYPTVELIDEPDGAITYRVTVAAVHAPTGLTVGYGVGSASSNEEKYKWRRAVCDEEWTERDLRGHARTKWAKGERGSVYSIKQVRTEPADLDNTILKMATKRARSDAILSVTAASDHFTQDADDMPEDLRREIYGEDAPPAEAPADPKERGPAPDSTGRREFNGSGDPEAPLAPAQVKLVQAALERKAKTIVDLVAAFKVKAIGELKARQINDILAWIDG